MYLARLKEKPIGVTIGIVVAIIVVISITIACKSSASSSSNQCQWVDVKPPAELHPKQIASSDFTAMVSFSGYMEMTLQPWDVKYLPLKLTEVEFTYRSNTGQLIKRLYLRTECAQIELYVEDSNTNYDYMSSWAVRLYPVSESMQSPSPITWKHCEVLDPPYMVFSGYEGFECDKTLRGRCSNVSAPGAVLVVDTIRFEVNGKPEKIKQGEYSKPPRHC